jgi:hypothetical protein
MRNPILILGAITGLAMIFLTQNVVANSHFANPGTFWELDRKYHSYVPDNYHAGKGERLSWPTVTIKLINSKTRRPVGNVNIRIGWPKRIGSKHSYYWDCHQGKADGQLYFRHPPHGQVNFKSPWYVLERIGKRMMCIRVYQIEPKMWDLMKLVTLHEGHNEFVIEIGEPVPVLRIIK